ncbi:MAG: C40 family peptidase [Chitinophagales bacterium]
MKRIIIAIVLSLTLLAAPFAAMGADTSTTEHFIEKYQTNYQTYLSHEGPIVDAFRTIYSQSLADQIVARAIWYMEYGFMVYGSHRYATTGEIFCSNFVYLVYKDFGYTLTSYASRYDQVGVPVKGVYSALKPGSTTRYQLVGVENLRPGDIFTFWKEDSNGNRYIGHVALYMGVINGKPCIIHTCGAGRPTAIGITNSFTWWYGKHFAGARRILGSSAQVPNYTLSKDVGPVIPESYVLPPQTEIIMPNDLPTRF